MRTKEEIKEMIEKLKDETIDFLFSKQGPSVSLSLVKQNKYAINSLNWALGRRATIYESGTGKGKLSK